MRSCGVSWSHARRNKTNVPIQYPKLEDFRLNRERESAQHTNATLQEFPAIS